MRRTLLEILRCPACKKGQLHSRTTAGDHDFGSIRCNICGAQFPVADGIADLLGDLRVKSGPIQNAFENPLFVRGFERYMRPALRWAVAKNRIDRPSEELLYQSMIGVPPGPVLDLACGTALYARKLAAQLGFPPVLGMDASRVMLEEAAALAREAAVKVDFIRAEAPLLPFQDNTLGAVLMLGSLILIEDAHILFRESFRVLKPEGSVVFTSRLPFRWIPSGWEKRAHFFLRSENQLRSAVQGAGFKSFQRFLLDPLVLVKATKPSEPLP